MRCVADFGISRALVGDEGGEALTETGVSVGTPAYMSPEQASGQRVDVRTDVYALGAVLYEMLAGEPPFTGPTPQAVIAKRFHTDPVPLRAVRPAVPEQVERAVARALARVPADRFASAAELAGHSRATRRQSCRCARAANRPHVRPHRPPAARARRAARTSACSSAGSGTGRRRRPPTRASGAWRCCRSTISPPRTRSTSRRASPTRSAGSSPRCPGLQVTARTSSAQYAASTKRPEEIGRELGRGVSAERNRTLGSGGRRGAACG